VDLLANAPDHRQRFTEIYLAVAWWMGQRHEGFTPPRAADPHMCQSALKGGSGAKLVQLVMNPE